VRLGERLAARFGETEDNRLGTMTAPSQVDLDDLAAGRQLSRRAVLRQMRRRKGDEFSHAVGSHMAPGSLYLLKIGGHDRLHSHALPWRRC
jgi:hypothetical protein